MAYGDIRDDWKLRDIESKADNASRQAQQAASNVDSMEHTVRQLSSDLDGLRNELQDTKYRLEIAENTIARLEQAEDERSEH